MATQSFIIDLEAKVIAAQKVLDECDKALGYEINGNTDTNGCHKENLDVWGTLGCNVSLLLSRGSKLYERIQNARRAAESQTRRK